ncbi:Retrovirus-related Pol polyprotein from transposon [Apostichopus japonicus]|uniref:Retrovirus-related Pol polyprotein from transposon n=1 Tax=Stichopus japonicus TaxID=307972 RepID=A0A2G8L083_STIJA|nr:Retrovirus-related Pol polyprotein from transposon [Apostichopus japonicus]
MKSPEDKEGLQRFMGVITYLAKFIPNLSTESAPLRALLEKGVHWEWGDAQQKSFQRLKEKITQAPVLKLFDVTKEVTLSVDSSSLGVGAVILQEGSPVAYASKSLTKSQQNYAQIEKEMLAIVFGCERFHEYLYGQKSIHVETDHKPLEPIFKKPLYQTPHRLQQMLMKVQKYPLSVQYRPGAELFIADTLSRASLKQEADNLGEKEFEVARLEMLPISKTKMSEILHATSGDEALES